MRDIQFTTPDSGWAVGGISGESIILQTTNGGVEWQSYPTQGLIGSSLREISMVDSRTGFVVGSAYGPPTIIGTTDGGATWQASTENPERPGGFESVSMVDAVHGWAVGAGATGYLYRTTSGGATWVSPGSEWPDQFSLAQNYPNPFNAQTVIGFQISDYGSVVVQIVDLLGQEVATIVNENLSPGSYSRQWDATGVPSGVYFYRLQAGSYMETKRLVLIR